MPSWYFHLVSIAFGLVVGSFLNVLIHRVPRGKSIVKPRSACPHCQTPIRWQDNIPVLGYLLLRGQCRKCKTKISVRYPVVELLTALLFLLSEQIFGFSWLLFVRDWPFVSLLVAITFIDLDHRIIPDSMSLGGLVLGLLTSFFVSYPGILEAAGGAALGFGLFYTVAWAYWKFTGRSGLGGGDIKLIAMLGAFLGPGLIFQIVIISSITGSVVGIAYALLSSKAKTNSEKLLQQALPFGPFLVLGALVSYYFGDLMHLFTLSAG